MNWRKTILFGAVLAVSGMAIGTWPAAAQKTTFQTYRCGDGSEFIVGFFQYDPRAHLQVDGKSLTLAKRVALSGSRYSGGGVTLKISRTGTTLKHARRPVTSCEPVA